MFILPEELERLPNFSAECEIWLKDTFVLVRLAILRGFLLQECLCMSPATSSRLLQPERTTQVRLPRPRVDTRVVSLTPSCLKSAQAIALGKLQAYWVPRFLLHQFVHLPAFLQLARSGNCSRCSHTTHCNIFQLLTPSAADDEVFPSPRRVHTRVPRIRAPSASVLRQAPRAPSR